MTRIRFHRDVGISQRWNQLISVHYLLLGHVFAILFEEEMSWMV